MEQAQTRRVRATHQAVREDIGDLITRRPMPSPRLQQLDPFLFLNHHGPQVYPPHNGGLPFGPHPHRGFETVTFIVQGSLAHRDTAGHESVIEAGGVQWMTAGRGVEHSELSPEKFLREGGPLEILQLWVNLPSSLKMTEPRYVGLDREQLPTLHSGDGLATIHLISGAWDGVEGPIEPLTGVEMTWLELRAGACLTAPASRERSVFFYVVRGRVDVAGATVEEFELAEMTQSGDYLEVEALSDSIVLFGHAHPIGEAVVSYGPFVMNSEREIDQALRDYRAGRFR